MTRVEDGDVGGSVKSEPALALATRWRQIDDVAPFDEL